MHRLQNEEEGVCQWTNQSALSHYVLWFQSPFMQTLLRHDREAISVSHLFPFSCSCSSRAHCEGILLQWAGGLRMCGFDRTSEWSESGNNWHSWLFRLWLLEETNKGIASCWWCSIVIHAPDCTVSLSGKAGTVTAEESGHAFKIKPRFLNWWGWWKSNLIFIYIFISLCLYIYLQKCKQ